MEPGVDKSDSSPTMATPPGQRTPTKEEEFLSKLMVKEFNRDRKRQWKRFCNGFKAHLQRQEELNRGQKNKHHPASSSINAGGAYSRRKERSRAKARTARHIGMLQTVNVHLEEKQEKMEEVLRCATKALEHVTATMLALVAEADEFEARK